MTPSAAQPICRLSRRDPAARICRLSRRAPAARCPCSTLQHAYKRAEDEGRTLIQSTLASAADIEVSETELRVRVAPLSSPHRTRVLAMLCGELNATATAFPGTNLILRYDVDEDPKRWNSGQNVMPLCQEIWSPMPFSCETRIPSVLLTL
jgi:hypothetical protein